MRFTLLKTDHEGDSWSVLADTPIRSFYFRQKTLKHLVIKYLYKEDALKKHLIIVLLVEI